MKRIVPLFLFAACGPPANSNPPVLWLAPDQNETHVKLVADEPDPY
ncbi:MAG TPA: hypothetical protein VFQ65_07890 [Kofleriaceae bacterium]|jgi:hypothetical protein|nr:hypothetical protein [Kofleriaceae bacterium]